MINNILLNGKIVNLEDEILNDVHTVTITRVWFEGDKVNLTTESFPFNQEEYDVLKKEAYENAVKFVTLMAEKQKTNEVQINNELVVEAQPVVEDVKFETIFEKLMKETKAGTIWISRAIAATNNDYKASLQYLFEKGLYDMPQQLVVAQEQPVVEDVKFETIFEKLMKETKAGAIWISRAMAATNDDYKASLQYLFEKGLYDMPQQVVVAQEQPVVLSEPVIEPVIVSEPVTEQKLESVVKPAIIDADVKPAKKKIAGKIVKYGLAAAIFLGGFSLVKDFMGKQKETATNDPKTEEIVEQNLVEHDITAAEFLSKSVEISDYLNEKGLKTSANEIYSTLYLSNMTYFEASVIDELTNSELKILSNSSKTMIEDSLGFLAEVDTFNNNLIEKSSGMSEEELSNKLISLQKFILSNQNDLENLRHMEGELVDIVKTKESKDKATKYINIFDYFSGGLSTDFPHTSSEGSIGGRYLQKTVGSQINQYSRNFMDGNALTSFETPITDLNNEIGYLNDCGFSFNSLTK